MEEKKKVYSGIRATGRLQLGNYLGAIKGMLELQDQYDCVFSVVDLHAITTPYEVGELQGNIKNVILDFLSAGLDPQKCLIEIQSSVPEHTELAYLLSTIYPVSRLEDLPTYKDKKAQHPKYVNMGLLYYPVLMAADIMLYKANLVPVGIDQEPHIEVAREIARKFNSTYGETFPEPQRFATKGEYVPSLTGSGKMSKSVEGSSIFLTDNLETITKKISKVPTDDGTVSGSEKSENAASFFKLAKLFLGEELYNKFDQDYESGNIRYSKMKPAIADAIYEMLKPIQERRREIEANFDLEDMLSKHTKICREVASNTLDETKRKMGLLSP